MNGRRPRKVRSKIVGPHHVMILHQFASPRRIPGLAAAGAAFLLTAFPGIASAQPTPAARRSVAAVPLKEGQVVVLDGKLDEPLWTGPEPATDFVQIDPANGRPATERTEVRVVYSKSSLYLGVMCYDSEPDKWIGYQRRRDEFHDLLEDARREHRQVALAQSGGAIVQGDLHQPGRAPAARQVQ